jgi:mannose-1-phosphate guanylyltransferase
VDVSFILLQQTVLRAGSLSLKMADPTEVHRFLIAQQLQFIGVKNFRILLEPEDRNTEPAIALAAFEVLRYAKNDVLMLVLPADHVIRDIAAFEAMIQQAV